MNLLMNLFTKQKQTHRHRKQIYGYKGEKGRGKDKLGVWDKQIHTITCKNQKGPIVSCNKL